MQISRRHMCLSLAVWPQVVVALQHARAAASGVDATFQVLDAEFAREIDALACQIIPSDDGPGAREAGVIHFIDRALATFASDELAAYRAGMADVQKRRKELFPESASIAALHSAQQMELIRAMEHSDFFDLLRTHTVFGFLGNPSYGGNRDKVGWTQIGFDYRMSYEHPFGYYDAQAAGEK